jgi:hypothetical protein
MSDPYPTACTRRALVPGLAAFVDAEIAKWQRVVAQAKIEVE